MFRAAVFPQRLGPGGDAWGGERAADPLHRAGIEAKPFGNDAHTGPSRSRQGLTDSFFECGGDWGAARGVFLHFWPAQARHGLVPQSSSVRIKQIRPASETCGRGVEALLAQE